MTPQNSYPPEEIVRALISALSNAGKGQRIPVHTNRIRSCQRYFAKEIDLQKTLRTLESLREIYTVGNGFWLPANVRRINLTDCWMLLGCYPTEHLESSVEILGSLGPGRLTLGPYPEAEEIDLSRWLEVDPDIKAWGESTIQHGFSSMEESSLFAKDLEVYVPWITRSGLYRSYSSPWLRLEEAGSRVEGFPLLAREKDYAQSSQILIEVRGGRIYESSYRLPNARRLRYSFDFIYGSFYRLAEKSSDREVNRYQMYFPLPREEERFVSAVGVISNDGKKVTYELPLVVGRAFEQLLVGLGIRLSET